jgi:hypothetical protein
VLASFNLYVRDASLERFIAAAEDPEIPSSVSLASSGFHPSLEYSTSQLDCCSYLPFFTGRTWNRNGMRCRARSVAPGFGSPKSYIERRIRRLRLAIGRLSTCRRQIVLGLSSDIARTLSTCRPLEHPGLLVCCVNKKGSASRASIFVLGQNPEPNQCSGVNDPR